MKFYPCAGFREKFKIGMVIKSITPGYARRILFVKLSDMRPNVGLDHKPYPVRAALAEIDKYFFTLIVEAANARRRNAQYASLVAGDSLCHARHWSLCLHHRSPHIRVIVHILR